MWANQNWANQVDNVSFMHANALNISGWETNGLSNLVGELGHPVICATNTYVFDIWKSWGIFFYKTKMIKAVICHVFKVLIPGGNERVFRF